LINAYTSVDKVITNCTDDTKAVDANNGDGRINERRNNKNLVCLDTGDESDATALLSNIKDEAVFDGSVAWDGAGADNNDTLVPDEGDEGDESVGSGDAAGPTDEEVYGDDGS